MHETNTTRPDGWVGFEIGVIRRLEFKSIALPFSGEPELGIYLKRLGHRVVTNDLAQWAHAKAKGFIETNEALNAEDISIVVDEAYVPREELYNPALSKWFNEIDAFWFDNVRDKIETLTSAASRAQALSIGMMVGDYVLSFDRATRELRQSFALSSLFEQLSSRYTGGGGSSQKNVAFNREARDFAAEQHTDLLFIRLPRARGRNHKRSISTAWREEWVRGNDEFWSELEQKRSGRLGDFVETRQQYLRLVEDFLLATTHIQNWAVSFVEDGFVSIQELAECIGRVRKVEAIYTKDFSELTGARAAIIVA
jgi:hypothetical protein